MGNLITAAVTNLEALADAVDEFSTVFTRSRGLAECVGEAMTCSETRSFADLLDGLGLPELAVEVLSNHYYADDEEGRVNHWLYHPAEELYFRDGRIDASKAGWHDSDPDEVTSETAAEYDAN
jgi:hypothetical protein